MFIDNSYILKKDLYNSMKELYFSIKENENLDSDIENLLKDTFCEYIPLDYFLEKYNLDFNFYEILKFIKNNYEEVLRYGYSFYDKLITTSNSDKRYLSANDRKITIQKNNDEIDIELFEEYIYYKRSLLLFGEKEIESEDISEKPLYDTLIVEDLDGNVEIKKFRKKRPIFDENIDEVIKIVEKKISLK